MINLLKIYQKKDILNHAKILYLLALMYHLQLVLFVSFFFVIYIFYFLKCLRRIFIFLATKPKSAIDDLFADTESDDIFSPKNITKIITKSKYSNNNNNQLNTENIQKKCLETVAPRVISNVATSTPETAVNTNNLFSDDEDITDLFGPSKNQEPNKKVRS